MTTADITKSFAEATYVLLSSLVAFAAGVFSTHLYHKHTTQTDEPEHEQFALNPTYEVKQHDLAKEVGELKGRIAALEGKDVT